CPMFWFSFNGRCYKYVAAHMTWADAELQCVSQKSNLASIHSLEENNFIQTMIQSYHPMQSNTWIGLSDLHKEAAWMWSDGSPVDFELWGSGQPDNAGALEDCVALNLEDEAKWNDSRCFNTFPFICASHKLCVS
ncbi:hypothetical protein NQD34_008356, partial [Periophthalmus magnuspinnatus]